MELCLYCYENRTSAMMTSYQYRIFRYEGATVRAVLPLYANPCAWEAAVIMKPDPDIER